MPSCTCHKTIYHQYVTYCDRSVHMMLKMTWDTDHKEKVSHQYVIFCDALIDHLQQMTWDTVHKEKVSHQYVSV